MILLYSYTFHVIMWKLLVFIYLLSITQLVQGQSREFILMFMENEMPILSDNPRGPELYIYNTADTTAQVSISVPNNVRYTCTDVSVNITAKSQYRHSLCPEIRHSVYDGTFSKKIIKVASSQDIRVFGLNTERYSSDAFHVTPLTQLGLNHILVNYNPGVSGEQLYGIVADQSTLIMMNMPSWLSGYVDIDGHRYNAGDLVTFRLLANSSFLIQSHTDLTGVIIQSSAPIALFIGTKPVIIGAGRRSQDALSEQLPSLSKWGNNFVVTAMRRRDNARDIVKIVASQPDTNVSLHYGQEQFIYLENKGSYIELMESNLVHITSNKPVLVLQVVQSQNMNRLDFNDPAMLIIPSRSSWSNSYFLPNFMNAVTDSRFDTTSLMISSGLISTVRINGQRLIDLPEYKGFVIEDSPLNPMVTAYIDVSSANTLITSNNAFLVTAYGASDRETYLTALDYNWNNQCEETMSSPGDGIDNDCDGEIDEEICSNRADDDSDSLIDEDCMENQVIESSGLDFAVTFMSNIVTDCSSCPNTKAIELYITVLEENTTVSISTPIYRGPGSIDASFNQLNKGTVLPVELKSDLIVGTSLGVSQIVSKGISVKSDKAIVVSGINKMKYSTDSFLAFPTNAAGSDYYVICHDPNHTVGALNYDRCEFAVIATVDNTVLNIALQPANNSIQINGIRYTGTFHIELKQAYQVLEIQSEEDMTGTRIWVDNPNNRLSVYTGNVRARIAANTKDHLVECLPSVSTWGSTFTSISSPRNIDMDGDKGDIWKFVASAPNTLVNFTYTLLSNGSTVEESMRLERDGSFYSLDIGQAAAITITADRPILVAQFSKSGTNTDPSMIILPSQSQWTNLYSFYTPTSGKFDEFNQSVPFDNMALITAEDSVVPTLFRSFYNTSTETWSTTSLDNEVWNDIPGTGFKTITLGIDHGLNVLNSSTSSPFMLLLFGMGDKESYGHPAGIRLTRNSLLCIEIPQALPGDRIDNDCDGVIDEEMCNGLDDDMDMRVDEDCSSTPTSYEYFVVYMENSVEYPRDYSLELSLGNTNEQTTKCRVSTPAMPVGGYDFSVGLNSNSAKMLAFGSKMRVDSSGFYRYLFHVACDYPITAFALNKETFSMDGYQAVPLQNLGYEYFTMSFSPATQATQFSVSNTANFNTVVEITSTQNVEINNRITLIAGKPSTVTLKPYETLHVSSEADLTGTRISSSNKVAVFTGNVRTNVKLSKSRDHLSEQLLPTRSWGTEFLLVPSHIRTVGDVFRVLARFDNTSLTSSSTIGSIKLNRGKYTEFELNADRAQKVVFDKQVQIVQIMKSQRSKSAIERGDPCLSVVPPVTQYYRTAAFFTPLHSQQHKSPRHYLTLITNTNDINGFLLDNNPLPSNITSQVIYNSDFTAVNLLVTRQNSLRLVTHQSGASFNGRLVGVADRESYCVNIGLNAPELN